MNHLENMFASLPLNYQFGVGENEISANLRGLNGLWKKMFGREGLGFQASRISEDL